MPKVSRGTSVSMPGAAAERRLRDELDEQTRVVVNARDRCRHAAPGAVTFVRTGAAAFIGAADEKASAFDRATHRSPRPGSRGRRAAAVLRLNDDLVEAVASRGAR